MNGKYIKNLVIFLLGGVIGGLISYKYLEERYSKMANDEIEDVKAWAKEKINKLNDKINVLENGQQEENVSEQEENEVKSSDLQDENIDYTKYTDRKVNSKNINENLKKLVNIDENREEQRIKNEGDIYQISPDEFLNEHEDYDKVTIFYYAGNNVLADDCKCKINDPEEYIGKYIWKNINLCFVNNEMYVRNHNIGADYEILLLDEIFDDGEGNND